MSEEIRGEQEFADFINSCKGKTIGRGTAKAGKPRTVEIEFTDGTRAEITGDPDSGLSGRWVNQEPRITRDVKAVRWRLSTVEIDFPDGTSIEIPRQPDDEQEMKTEGEGESAQLMQEIIQVDFVDGTSLEIASERNDPDQELKTGGGDVESARLMQERIDGAIASGASQEVIDLALKVKQAFLIENDWERIKTVGRLTLSNDLSPELNQEYRDIFSWIIEP
jgi:hypothetical protein